jgi:hypothetical protein
MLMTGTERATHTRSAGWQTRRKVLLTVVALVPIVLIGYSLGVSAMVSLGDVLGEGMPLVFTASLVMAIGGYVIWDSLTSLARIRVTARHPRRALGPVRRRFP